MARRIQRKDLKQDEFVEAAVDASHWLEENWKTVALGAGGAVVVVLAVAGWTSWSRHREELAREELSRAIASYQEAEEAGNDPARLATSLEALEAAVDRAGGGAAGQSARFYRAAALSRLGRSDEAAAELGALVGEELEPTLGATSRYLLARLHADAGRHAEATALLEELTSAEQPLVPVPQALVLLAEVRGDAGDDAGARAAWQRIVDDFPETEAATLARQRLARDGAS
jgi:predicted negative regulator of RcsB-dependent stress response